MIHIDKSTHFRSRLHSLQFHNTGFQERTLWSFVSGTPRAVANLGTLGTLQALSVNLTSLAISSSSKRMTLTTFWKIKVLFCYFGYQLSRNDVVAQNPEVPFTECFEDAQFFLVNEIANFEEAKNGCVWSSSENLQR